MQSGFQTEMEFTLPRGYLDSTGILHRKGVMRLATAGDEILPLRDPRVQQNAAYMAVIVLARVVTRLGDLPDVDCRVIEGLYASDFDHLQRLYERINGVDDDVPSQGQPEAYASNPTERVGSVKGLSNGAGLRGMRALGEA
jgi:hypothetical protein